MINIIQQSSYGKAYIWKHVCDVRDCGEVPCNDPWTVELPLPLPGANFATFPEAIAYAASQMGKPVKTVKRPTSTASDLLGLDDTGGH